MAQQSDREGHPPSDKKQSSAGGNAPDAPSDPYDSNLRLTLALIKASDWYQLAARTGIEWQGAAPLAEMEPDDAEPQFLHLFVELDRERFETRDPEAMKNFFSRFQLKVMPASLRELARNPALRTIPARIQLNPRDPARTTENRDLEGLLAELASNPSVTRVRSSIPHGRCLERSLSVLDMPPNDQYKNHKLTGQNVIVGIIDDGCALAHPDFLTPVNRKWTSRVLYLWDQSRAPLPKDKIWTDDDVEYGRELKKSEIDKKLARSRVSRPLDEDAIYRKLRLDVGVPGERATHGTRVMGIAAGNGNSMMGARGVAPEAGIIFVQLPPSVVRETPKALSKHIVDGATYIFDRALALGLPAVVNISYGGYSGSHDGTSPWEAGLDELLEGGDERAIVVSAGNGFEADCHAMGRLKTGETKTLHWNLQPFDPTVNDLEIWYNGDAELELTLTAPDGTVVFGPSGFCLPTPVTLRGKPIGFVTHAAQDQANGDNSVLIALGSTHSDSPQAGGPVNAPLALVDPGGWQVHLRNQKPNDAKFHAWIFRDDLGGHGRMQQQSRFAAEDASPGYTLCDMATGKLTIAAGAFNAATNEVCAYSASGPTRESTRAGTQNGNPSRPKPDIYAPAEELAGGGGVLASASRSALPWRLNGTSAAAPHVTGVVALMFEYDRKRQAEQQAPQTPPQGQPPQPPAQQYQAQPLKAADVLNALTENPGIGLIANRRLALASPTKDHDSVWDDLVVRNNGPISAMRTLDNT